MWTFKIPTAITFGAGAVRQLPQIAAGLGARPLLVADHALVELPLFARVQEALPGVPVFSDVTPDPTVMSVDDLAARLRVEQRDLVVVVGGGSAMDCAKAAACLAAGDLPSIRAVHATGVSLGPARLPVIAVPTTAGTGSEVTPFAVLNDPDKQLKAPIAGDALYPVHAVVDPELTHSLPRQVTVVTGLDALSHAVEAYWSRGHQPLCDLLAIEAARLICLHLKQAAQQPDDAPARTAMSYAATLAGAAFQLPKNALVHACSFPLSTRYHLPHGAACAFMLEEAIRFNAPVLGDRLTAFLLPGTLETYPTHSFRDHKEFTMDKDFHEMEMRFVYGETLSELIDQNPHVMCLEADLSKASGTNPTLSRRHPANFLNVGVAEANMISIAAGLASEGKIPFCASFSCFATRRVYDQITIRVAYAHMNVKIVGTAPGVTAGPNGGTHM